MSEPAQETLLPDPEADDVAERATAAAVAVLRGHCEQPVSFLVPGVAQPGGSKRGFVHPKNPKRVIITDANKNLKPWQEVIRANVEAQRPDWLGTDRLLSGSLAIVVGFERVRPPSHYRQGKATGHLLRKGAPARPTMAPDTTKLLRGTEDALTGEVWLDDALVVWQLATKRYTSTEQTTIDVYALGPP